MYLRQDCAFAPDGTRHDVCATEAALTINTIPVPGFADADTFFARIVVDAAGVQWVIASDNRDEGVTLLRNGQPYYHFDGPYGFGFAALRPAPVEIYLMGPHDGVGGCVVQVYSPEGQWLRDYTTMPYSSEGMIDLAPDGTPISANRGSISFADGAQLWNWMQRGSYFAGGSNGGDTQNGSVALLGDNDPRMAQIGNIQLPVRLAVHPFTGAPIVAPSGENVPSPIITAWEPFHRAPGPTPEPIPPSVILPFTAWIVDVEGIVTPRGNGISTADGPGPRYYEDTLWVTPAMEPTLEAQYWGPEPPRNGIPREAAYAQARDMALRNGTPVCVNDEWGLSPTTEWIRRFTEDGVQAVWQVEAYRPAGESIDQYRARLRARLDHAGPIYSVIPPYFQQQGGGSEASSIETLNVCREELARCATPPIVIDLFGLRRPPKSAAREADAQAWIAACPEPPSLRRPKTTPIVTGIAPAPIYKAACYAKSTLHGTGLAAVDTVLISGGEFVIVRTAPTTIEGFTTFRGPGVMQLVAYVGGQPAPNFFFTVA